MNQKLGPIRKPGSSEGLTNARLKRSFGDGRSLSGIPAHGCSRDCSKRLERSFIARLERMVADQGL